MNAATGVDVRLTMVGHPSPQTMSWAGKLGAKYIEIIEFSSKRQSWQFQTDAVPIEPVRRLSRRWPKLTFLLDYEQERIKGMLIAHQSKLVHSQFEY